MDLHETAGRLLADVPGCSLMGISPDGPLLTDVRILGWSPTLHPMNMNWSVRSRPSAFEQDLAVHIARQQMRRGNARALRLPDDEPQPIDAIGHIAMDRVVLSMMSNVQSTVVNTIAAIVAGFVDTSGQIVNGSTMRARDAGAEITPPHPRLAIAMTSPASTFDGEALRFKADLPTSVCLAAIGRMVGDVVKGDAGLEDVMERVIVHADSRDGHTTLVVRGDWVPLAYAI